MRGLYCLLAGVLAASAIDSRAATGKDALEAQLREELQKAEARATVAEARAAAYGEPQGLVTYIVIKLRHNFYMHFT